jgi:hypothetical protein
MVALAVLSHGVQDHLVAISDAQHNTSWHVGRWHRHAASKVCCSQTVGSYSPQQSLGIGGRRLACTTRQKP